MAESPAGGDGVVRVDFTFRRELAEKIEGNLASYCYQCGACVGDCPATAYSDTFNPRELMLKVLYGLSDELLGEESVLWQCTNCYNCHERCPQQVKPVEVIISLKNMLADRGVVPPAVAKVIEAFETTGRTTQSGPPVDRQREQFGLPPLAPAPIDEIRALLAAAPAAGEAARSEVARGGQVGRQENGGGERPSRRFVFFPGCLIPARHPAMEFAIRHTLAGLEIELVDLPGASCCPDPINFKSKDKLAWLSVAARNLSLAEDLDLDVATNCSGCTATLSEACHLLAGEELRGRVNERLARIGRTYRGTSRVRHIATLLRDVAGDEAIQKSVVRPLTGLKVAIHYGCHLLKPSAIMRVDDPNDPTMMERLVTALGATPVRHRSWYLCCGKACQTDEIPANMMHDLLSSVRAERADILCLICTTCFTQFDHGQLRVAQRFGEDFSTPPIYYFQLLAFAQGVGYDALDFERQRFKPECLRRFETGGGAGA